MLIAECFLLPRQTRAVSFSDDLFSVVCQLARLREKIKRLNNLRIALSSYLETFFLSERIHEQFALDIGTDPLVVLHQIGFGVRRLVSVERLAELLHHALVHFEVLRNVMSVHVVFREVEERIML